MVASSKNFLQSILLKSEDKTYNNKKYKEKGKGGGGNVHPSGLVGMKFDICYSKIAVIAVLTSIGSLPNQLEVL